PRSGAAAFRGAGNCAANPHRPARCPERRSRFEGRGELRDQPPPTRTRQTLVGLPNDRPNSRAPH
ncbi:hypothetical protein ACFW9L_38555, partial [Streptomyces sp. NPDC059517]|uniref:hypothetical protein n=1 Tax=Streptomyces sp. NPDC059517 TaxID=3346855 RepID=UPI0036BA3156